MQYIPLKGADFSYLEQINACFYIRQDDGRKYIS